MTLLQRFEKKYIPEPNSGCWLWLGTINNAGYGRLRYDKSKSLGSAHRIAWELFRGPIPDGLLALHRCDNSYCVNPDHLFIGDYKANVRDSKQKGRRAKWVGKLNNSVKLSESDVLKIRTRTGRLIDVAKEFGVCVTTISNIRRRINWSHI